MDKRIYIDSNILVYHLVEDRRYGPKSRELLKEISSQKLLAFTSVYTTAEVYATLRAFGFPMHRIIEAIEEMLQFGMTMLPLPFEIMVDVPSTMRQEKLGFGDAIHVLTMRENGLSCILTEDRHFDSVSGVKRMGLER